jgi:hypothetical protein
MRPATARAMRRGVLAFLTLAPLVAPADGVRSVDPQSGLASWKVEDSGFSLQLLQVLPDYVRAVYASRGLPEDVIERVASNCVFGTIIRNESDAPLTWRLTDWRFVTADGEQHRVKPKSAWVEEWRKAGIAFRWTLLADEQTYEIGDWGQGFITLKLAPGEAFDLHYSWSQHDQSHTGMLRELRCASERDDEN